MVGRKKIKPVGGIIDGGTIGNCSMSHIDKTKAIRSSSHRDVSQYEIFVRIGNVNSIAPPS
jgi:hypothetical protein